MGKEVVNAVTALPADENAAAINPNINNTPTIDGKNNCPLADDAVAK